jgi:hypothetical protein
MNSYISNPSRNNDRTHIAGSYVSTASSTVLSTGYVSSTPRRGDGTYIRTQWVRAA